MYNSCSAGDGTNGSAFLQKLQQDSADHLDGSYHTTPLADVANDRGLSSEPYVRLLPVTCYKSYRTENSIAVSAGFRSLTDIKY